MYRIGHVPGLPGKSPYMLDFLGGAYRGMTAATRVL